MTVRTDTLTRDEALGHLLSLVGGEVIAATGSVLHGAPWSTSQRGLLHRGEDATGWLPLDGDALVLYIGEIGNALVVALDYLTDARHNGRTLTLRFGDSLTTLQPAEAS